MTVTASSTNTVRADAPSGGQRIIEIGGLNKWFGEFHVLRDIHLSVNKGEVVVVIGPSGSGKSTLIRCINRLEEHQEGKIVVDGTELTDDVKKIDQVRRETGMVFQQFNLFPHLTVLENITLAPVRVLGLPRADAEARAMTLLARIGLDAKARDYPDRLSGGQQQRVAIVRALAMDPMVLLLDEITSALDVSVQAKVLDLFQELQREQGFGCLFISHDLGVVEILASRIAVMYMGKIVELGDRDQIVRNPQHDYTKRLVAAVPVLHVEHVGAKALKAGAALGRHDALGDHARPARSASLPCSSPMRSSMARTSRAAAPCSGRSTNHSFSSPPSRPWSALIRASSRTVVWSRVERIVCPNPAARR